MEASNLRANQDRSERSIRIGLLVNYPYSNRSMSMSDKEGSETRSDIIVAILRIIYLANTDFIPVSDCTWDSTDTYVWSVIESSLGVTFACSPVLRPLFYPWLPSLKTSIYKFAGSFTWKRSHKYEAYADLSNGELALRDLGAFHSTTPGSGNSATLNTGTVAGANAATSNSFAHEEITQPHTIHVKNEVSVRSLVSPSGKVPATVRSLYEGMGDA